MDSDRVPDSLFASVKPVAANSETRDYCNTDLSDAPPATAHNPAPGGFPSLATNYFKNKQLKNNLEEDKRIYTMTSAVAMDPFLLRSPGATSLAVINTLEKTNITIDVIRQGASVGEAIKAFPELKGAGDVMQVLGQIRDQINRKIDSCLQQALQAVTGGG